MSDYLPRVPRKQLLFSFNFFSVSLSAIKINTIFPRPPVFKFVSTYFLMSSILTLYTTTCSIPPPFCFYSHPASLLTPFAWNEEKLRILGNHWSILNELLLVNRRPPVYFIKFSFLCSFLFFNLLFTFIFPLL